MAYASRTSTADAHPPAGKAANTRAMLWHELCRRQSSSALPRTRDERAVRRASRRQNEYYPKDRGAASTGLRKSGKTGVIVSAAPLHWEPRPWPLGAKPPSEEEGQPTAR